MKLELHPLCTLFPRLGDTEFRSLVADIRANGLRQAIVTHNGMILDGGNRYRACLEAGEPPRFREYEGANIVSFVLSANLHRRHLTPGQQAAIVASATDWGQAQGVGRPQSGSVAGLNESGNAAGLESGSVAGLSRVEDRAALSGASERTQRMADKVARADPELAKRVAQGSVSLPDAMAQVEGKPSGATKRQQATSSPATTNTADDEGPSAAEMLDEMQADLRKAEGRVAELEKALAEDGKEAVVKLSQRLEHAERRQAELQEDARRWQVRAEKYERTLARIGKAVGDRDLDQVAARVEAMARTVRGKVAA